MLIYQALNKDVIDLVPSGARCLLDIGCGDGSMGAYLKSLSNIKVVGITYSQEEAAEARTRIDEVIVADINLINLQSLGNFDCVVCSHVLEHSFEPQHLLEKIRSQLSKDGLLVVALPNVLYWKQRWKFLLGSFQYTEGGLMDKTHFRFFDWKTAQSLLTENGYEIVFMKATGAFPLPVLRKLLPSSWGKSLDSWACKCWPGLFGYQFLFSCKSSK